MRKDLRTYIKELENVRPDEIKKVKKAIIPRLGIPSYLFKMERVGQFNAVLFEKVTDAGGKLFKFPVISNLFASRYRIGLAIGADDENSSEKLTKISQTTHPLVIGKDEAPVKEVVYTGKRVDVNLLPIVTHHEGDAGAYITAASVWCKDIDTGAYNCAILRLWAKEGRTLGIHLNPHGHSFYHMRRWTDRQKPMPVAICIGHHPAFYLGTLAKVKGNEIEYIGSYLDEPLAVTSSETLGEDFLVPADAEIVLEGEIPPDVYEPEGPFGDFTGYTDPCKPHNVVKLTGMTFRRDAIYLDIFSGHRDHFLMDAPMIENLLLMRLRQIVPTVKKVFLPYSGCCRFHAYIQLEKTNDGQPHSIIYNALSSDFRLKHVVVVDEDIDVENEGEVLWAVATRSQWDKDMVVLPRACGTVLDPSGENGISSKGGIDATVPLSKKFPSKNVVPLRI